MNKLIQFPKISEYPSYVEMYMKYLKKDGALLQQLEDSFDEIYKIVISLTNDQLLYRYQVGKWTIKEILVHNMDDERVYGFRALAFARKDNTELPGFEQDDYARFSEANDRTIISILDEYKAIRWSTIKLFEGFSEKALKRIGVANGNRASVRALGYHILGHERHHLHIIKDWYLKAGQ